MIDDNSRYHMILGIQDIETAKVFTERTGHKTVYTTSMNNEEEEESVRKSEVGVPLVRVEEWRNLQKPILFPFGGDPVKLDQVWVSRDYQNPQNDYIDPVLLEVLEEDLSQIQKQVSTTQPVLEEVAREHDHETRTRTQ